MRTPADQGKAANASRASGFTTSHDVAHNFLRHIVTAHCIYWQGFKWGRNIKPLHPVVLNTCNPSVVTNAINSLIQTADQILCPGENRDN
jgi:hypothetical protein